METNRAKYSNIIRYGLLIFLLAAFSVYFLISPHEILSMGAISDSVYVLICSLFILAASFFFLKFFCGIKDDVIFASVLAVAAAGLALRLYFFNEISNDYVQYLSRWLSEMRALDGLKPLTTPIGDYNMPYLYFLFGVSKIGIYDLYQIKILSVFFDFLLAFGALKIVSVYSKSDVVKLFAFAITLFVPTIFLNSAYWGQCDVLYTALCIWALYFALKEKGELSIVFFALGFSVKIQSIFILPIIIFLIFAHKINLKQLLYFPLTFFLTLLPAILCGRSLYDTFSIYIDQASSYPELTLNCPTFWAFFHEDTFDVFGDAALFLAGAVLLVFCIYIYANRAKLNNVLLFDIAFILVILIPFVLPRMHERYFYLAEAMCGIYILLHRRRFAFPPIIILTSFFCYYAYLFGYRIISLEFSAFLNLALIVYLCKNLYDDFNKIAPKESLK